MHRPLNLLVLIAVRSGHNPCRRLGSSQTGECRGCDSCDSMRLSSAHWAVLVGDDLGWRSHEWAASFLQYSRLLEYSDVLLSSAQPLTRVLTQRCDWLQKAHRGGSRRRGMLQCALSSREAWQGKALRHRTVASPISNATRRSQLYCPSCAICERAHY